MEMPGLSLGGFYDRTDPRAEQALRAQIAAHADAWFREERVRERAEAIAARIRDALIAGTVTTADVMALLVNAPPPAPPGLVRRMASALRRMAMHPLTRKGI